MINSFKVKVLPNNHQLTFGFGLFADTSDVLLTLSVMNKKYINGRHDIARARVTAEQLRNNLEVIESEDIKKIAEWLEGFSNRGD